MIVQDITITKSNWYEFVILGIALFFIAAISSTVLPIPTLDAPPYAKVANWFFNGGVWD